MELRRGSFSRLRWLFVVAAMVARGASAAPPEGEPSDDDPKLARPHEPVMEWPSPSENQPIPRRFPIRARGPQVRIDLVDGTAIDGEITALDGDTLTLATGDPEDTGDSARPVRVIPRRDVVAISSVVLGGYKRQIVGRVGTAPSASRALDRFRKAAFLDLAITPRLLFIESCIYTSLTGCLQTALQTGYGMSGTIGLGWALRETLLLSFETNLGGASLNGRSLLVWDQLLVMRWLFYRNLFVELGAGIGFFADAFGFAAREGFGYDLRIARNLSFAPTLSTTQQVGADRLHTASMEAQFALRYYF